MCVCVRNVLQVMFKSELYRVMCMCVRNVLQVMFKSDVCVCT